MQKVLIIEDEMTTAKLMKKHLSDNHYHVIHADDAYKGVELAIREKPDIIILDMMLPAGGGMVVLQRIKLLNNTRDIPVIVQTASTDENFRKQIMEKGVNAFLLKPFDPVALLKEIKNILG